MVLIDTSCWTHALRRKGGAQIRRRVEEHILNVEAAWCDVVRLELWHGVRHQLDRNTLMKLESEIASLAITDEVWETACDLGAFARGKGLNLPATDLMIFACGRVHEVAIEHHDQHFDLLSRAIGGLRLPGRAAGG